MSHVKPEHLLDYADYRRWQKIHRKLTGTNEEDSLSDSSTSKFEFAQFEAISAQAWTHILCQLIKVLYRRLISYQIRSHSFARRDILPCLFLNPLTGSCLLYKFNMLCVHDTYIPSPDLIPIHNSS